jgi:hypothetical protein
VENIRSYIDKYEYSRFYSDDYAVAAPATTIIKSGYRKTIWNDDEERVNTHFLFTTGGWKEACGDLNAKEAARSLFELGVLVARSIDHMHEPITPPKGAGSKARMYVIDRNKLIEADGGIPNSPRPLEVEDAI